MSGVPLLDSLEKQLAWKKSFRTLLRRCGKQQQEVAIEMARIVSTMGKPVHDHAFVSSLSRFANGRDSAFPSWFYKEETRLAPMAQAMGLSSTGDIWSILRNVTGEISEKGIWHPAFPQAQAEISVRLNGKQVTEVAKKLYQKAKRVPGALSVWIYGSKQSGRSYAAGQLSRAFSDRCTQVEGRKPQLHVHCVESPPSDPAEALQCFRLSPWGREEYTQLCTQLDDILSQTQKALAKGFIQEIPSLLDFLAFHAFEAIHLFRMILDRGVPSSSKVLLEELMRYFWGLATENGFSLVSLSYSNWSALWGDFFARACINGSISDDLFRSAIDERFGSYTLLDRKSAIGQLKQMADAPKKERERISKELSNWLLRSSADQLLDALSKEGLVEQKPEGWVAFSNQQIFFWAAYGYVRHSEITLPHTYLLHPHCTRFLHTMFLFGLSEETLSCWLDEAPSSLWLEVCASKLRYAIAFPVSWSQEELISIWSCTLYAEIYRLLYSSTEVSGLELSTVLIAFSERYSDILPRLSVDNSLLELSAIVPHTVRKQAEILSVKPIRSIQALAPYQVPPKNYMKWRNWERFPQVGPYGWQVIHYFAEEGEDWAQQLISEGDGTSSSPWIHVPILERLAFLGHCGVRKETLRAARNACVDIWQSKPHEQFGWEPDCQDILFESLMRCGVADDEFSLWSRPSSLAQQIVRHRQPFLSYCTVWFLLRTKQIKALEDLFIIFQRWGEEGIEVEDGLLRCGDRTIPIQNCTEEEIRRGITVFLLHIAEVLYRLGELDFLHRVWNDNILGLRMESFQILAQQYDRSILLNWITHAPKVYPKLHRVLSQDSKYLRLAWRLDRKGRRRKELLSFALTFSKLPQWSLSEAKRILQEESVWPQWLSPHRVEVQEMVVWMAQKSTGRQKIWWGSILNRRQPNHPIFVEALRSWALWDPDPLSDLSLGSQSFLSVNATPTHSAMELVQFLLNLSERPSWFFDGVSRLWEQAHEQSEEVALLLLFILAEQNAHEVIFFTGWEQCGRRLQAELTRIWMQRATTKEMRTLYETVPSTRDILRKELLAARDVDTFTELKKDFALHLSSRSFYLLIKVMPDEIYSFLDAIRIEQPDKERALLLVVRQYLELHQDSGLFLWLRRTLEKN